MIRRGSVRGSAIAIVTSAAALVIAATPAAGHDRTFNSDVTLGIGVVGNNEDTVWSGAVTSPKEACEPGRRVELYRVNEGGPDVFLGYDRTGPTPGGPGGFTIFTDGYPPPDGTYYAKVTRKNIGPQGHHHICKAARSKSIVVT
jgi:hypothetical protein